MPNQAHGHLPSCGFILCPLAPQSTDYLLLQFDVAYYSAELHAGGGHYILSDSGLKSHVIFQIIATEFCLQLKNLQIFATLVSASRNTPAQHILKAIVHFDVFHHV